SMTLGLLLVTLLLTTAPPPATPLPFVRYQTLFSLAHSLTSRVAALRASRGDQAGAARARLIADKLDFTTRGVGLGFWAAFGSMGWDYVKNYAWRDAASFEMLGAVSDLNELMRAVAELARLDSEAERATWLRGHYGDVLRVSKSLLGRLLKVFRQSVYYWRSSLQSRMAPLDVEDPPVVLLTQKFEVKQGNVGLYLCVSQAYYEAQAGLVDGRLFLYLVLSFEWGPLECLHTKGPIREVVETVQREVIEGELLKDCLELGTNDLKGLIQVVKDIALQFSSTDTGRSDL
ncbi:hypothetical protein RJ639_014613, partial [Escallonia herrerae]